MKIALITVIVTSLLFSAFGQTTNTNTYSNPTLGVTITKLTNWCFLTVEQFTKNLGRLNLSDEKFKEQLQKYATAPLVVMAKHPEPFDDLNPSLKITARPLGVFSADDPKAIVTAIVPILSKTFTNCKIVVAPTEIVLAGKKAGYTKLDYDLSNTEGQTFPACSELWIVPRDKYCFIIGAGIRQDEKTGSREEIQKILSSLKIE